MFKTKKIILEEVLTLVLHAMNALFLSEHLSEATTFYKCLSTPKKWIIKWTTWLRDVSYFKHLWKQKVNIIVIHIRVSDCVPSSPVLWCLPPLAVWERELLLICFFEQLSEMELLNDAMI